MCNANNARPVPVRVVSRPGVELPTYATSGAACVDLRADLADPVTIPPGGTALISTGLRIELPDGYEAQIRARSGLALRHGVAVANGVGIVDSDYRGPVGVILRNDGPAPFVVAPGDRVAQMAVRPVYRIEWLPVENLTETGRGGGGFGSTGKN